MFLSVRPATRSSITTAAATATSGRFSVASWQKNCWDSYLATGRGSDDLFQSIDSDQDTKISKQEIDVFLQSVNYKGVHPRAFKMLDELASDHEMTLKEFKSWLVRRNDLPNLDVLSLTFHTLVRFWQPSLEHSKTRNCKLLMKVIPIPEN
jgi:hypothetical protein